MHLFQNSFAQHPGLALQIRFPAENHWLLLMGVFPMTHTSKPAYLHCCLRSKPLQGGDLKQFSQQDRTLRGKRILWGELLQISLLQEFTA